MCLFDKPVYDVVNTLVFLVTGRLVSRHIAGRNPVLLRHEVGAFLAMFLFIPYFGQSVLWMSGAANYLWMSAVTLATLLPYRLHRTGQQTRALLVPAMLGLGLLGGSTNENSAGAWLLMALVSGRWDEPSRLALRFRRGWPRTRECTCTSPRPRAHGSTSSRCSSGSAPVKPSAAAASTPSPNSSQRSERSSPAGTTAATPSPGPRTADEILPHARKRTSDAGH